MSETFPARQAEPGQTFTVNDRRGAREFRADAQGIVRPADEIEEAACVTFGLPIVKKAAIAVKES